jgi:hypothetical protein
MKQFSTQFYEKFNKLLSYCSIHSNSIPVQLCDLTRSLCQICKKCTRQWRYDANNDETERIGSDAIINTGLADGIIA